MIEKLFDLAKQVHSHAYAPYSKYPVAVALLTETGNYYQGCNVENASYGLTQCAEASAIGQMITTEGNVKIDKLLVLAISKQPCTPCGACRQRIQEFATAKTMIWTANPQQILTSFKFSSLFPYSFSSEHLEV